MAQSERLLSLDVFRGMTVAGMILVNNPGSWSTVYSPLLHAQWHGCTPTDLIFPFFLFIVGVSIHLAFSKQRGKLADNQLLFKAFIRSLKIFGLGMILAGFPYFDFTSIRIPGVLQRIALVFFACSFIYLKTTPKTQIYLTAFILVFYWALMSLVPVPGVGAANLTPEGNLGAWLDRLLLEGHLWKQSKTWDPEGLLSTMPAIATALIGVVTSRFLLSDKAPAEKVAWMFVYGTLLTVLGLWWHLVFPLNKSLWTSSYVVYTGGLAIYGLAFCYWIVDVQKSQWWIVPFQAYGINAITAFFGSGLLIKAFIYIKLDLAGESTSLLNYLYQNSFALFLSPYNASLAMAIFWILFFLIPIGWMYHKKIIIKV